uniref:EGF-like domain-containing protein n=1 Tax=Macrostomum lignano TaxID=282301 RepID=A0A1I8F6R8_9PLAT
MAATRRLVVRLTAKNLEHLPLLQLAVTAVRIGPCQSDTEFDCGAGRCIDSRLRCNGYANCPTSRTKEATVLAGAPLAMPRPPQPKGTPLRKPTGKGDEGHHAVILGTLGGIIIVAVLLSLVCHIRRIRRHRRRQEQGQRDDAACGTPTSEPANGSVRLLSETKLWRQSPSSMPLTATQSLRRLQQTTAVPLLQLEATRAAVPCAAATAAAAGGSCSSRSRAVWPTLTRAR